MRHSKATMKFITFLFLELASTFVSSSVVQWDHIIRIKGTNKNNTLTRSNIIRGTHMNMELTKSILVQQTDAPNQICYNSTFPYLVSVCASGDGYFCSKEAPFYGCTKESSKSCNEIHLCNTPIEILVCAAVISIIIILLITTGCLWCCCCCGCGKCCKNNFPWFAKMQIRQITLIDSPNRIYPITPGNDWETYRYDRNRTPDTVIAKSQKSARMEDQQKQIFDRDNFPPPPLNSFPSAPQLSGNDTVHWYSSSVPVYSPPRHANLNITDMERT